MDKYEFRMENRNSDNKKVSSTLQLPYPLNLEGIGVSFFCFFLHNSLMNILLKLPTPIRCVEP